MNLYITDVAKIPLNYALANFTKKVKKQKNTLCVIMRKYFVRRKRHEKSFSTNGKLKKENDVIKTIISWVSCSLARSVGVIFLFLLYFYCEKQTKFIFFFKWIQLPHYVFIKHFINTRGEIYIESVYHHIYVLPRIAVKVFCISLKPKSKISRDLNFDKILWNLIKCISYSVYVVYRYYSYI
jgi:hypothetical protein